MIHPIVIIGAGPGGSVAATLLARARVPVTLIEQHRFPRDKVCGECVSSLGIDVLKRIGAIDRLHDAVVLNRCVAHGPAGAKIEVDLPRKMLGISRRSLDETLLKFSREAGS